MPSRSASVPEMSLYITDRHNVTPFIMRAPAVLNIKYPLVFALVIVALPSSPYATLLSMPPERAFLKLSLPRIRLPPPVILVSFFTSEESPSTVAFRSVYLPVRSLAFTSRPSTLVLISSILPVRFL